MAHRTTVTSVWTAVLAAIVALLGALGLGGKAVAVTGPAPAPVVVGSVPVPATAVHRAGVRGRRSWRAMMRGGSLPPTIKQRIRAEAHGKTPSVRSSTTAAALGTGSGSGSGSGSRSRSGSGVGVVRSAAVARSAGALVRVVRPARSRLALAA